MLTVENIWTKPGYSGHDHLLPDAQNVFGDMVGRQFRSLRDVHRAIAANNTTYCAPNDRREYARNMAMGANIRHASGRIVRVDL